MADLRIAAGLALPVDVVTQPIAILARRGAGKTYTASVIVEEVVRAKVPVVILDPTGAWWGLRSSVDGERPGLPVVIFGGDHGDVALEPSAGKVIADVVIDHPGAYVVDLSGFESKAAEVRFAADFLERLYRAKKRETGPLLLVVDEADVFAPQRPGPDQTRTLGATEAIVRRGRIKGLGNLLITQRAAVLNKNVLTQTEVLVVMQTTGPQDRAAIDDWIAGNGTREERDEVLGSLASLEQGEAWIWSPSFLRILRRVRIRARTTFDSSRTPEAGEVAIAPRAFAEVDLEQLGARIAATIEQQKANDPAELRRRIHELERDLVKTRADHADPIPEVREVIVEIPVLNGQVERLAGILEQLVPVAEAIRGAGDQLVIAASEIRVAISRTATAPRPAPDSPAWPRGRTPRVERVSPGRTGAPQSLTAADRTGVGSGPRAVASGERIPGGAPRDLVEARQLKAGARRMLSALAQLHPTPLTRVQIATLSDVSPAGGTFSDYLSAIRSNGLIVEERGSIALSDTGQDLVAGELGSGAPSSSELLGLWGRKLKAGARRMLQVLHDSHPDGLTRAELAERAEVSAAGGTFSDYLSSLRRNGLLDEAGGLVRAGEALFLGGRR
jgi:hypothetical protein